MIVDDNLHHPPTELFHKKYHNGLAPPHEVLFAIFQKSENQLRRTQAQSTLFALVAATPSLSTLGAAVVRAGLDGTLKSNQVSLTVFAPNNDAFGKVPAGIANNLFKVDAFLPHLTDLLLYHVLGTRITTNQHVFFDGKFLTALNGESLAIIRPPITVNRNLIIARNIAASNGVANVIDGVLLPSWVSNSITDRVVADSDLSTLLALVGLAELGDALAGPGQLTLVAPTNSAFRKLPKATVSFLTSRKGKATLTSILLYHVFPDIIVSSELSNGLTTSTLEGGIVTVSVNTSGIFFNDAKVVKADILTNNGVVHKIDTVLDPTDGR
jgi:transforming growth factor-beta-induced protein